MKDRIGDAQSSLNESFQLLFGEHELLAKVIEFFPYPIQIFSTDGIARMINKATLEMIGIRDVESHVGIYNVFRDPIVRGLGCTEQVRQVLEGKTVYLTDFNVPYQDLKRHFNMEDRDIQTISSDITCFPLKNADGVFEYFAAVFIICLQILKNVCIMHQRIQYYQRNQI